MLDAPDASPFGINPVVRSKRAPWPTGGHDMRLNGSLFRNAYIAIMTVITRRAIPGGVRTPIDPGIPRVFHGQEVNDATVKMKNGIPNCPFNVSLFISFLFSCSQAP
jgi:hypothetical protein